MASYFRRFIGSFATIASPLTNLTIKDCPFRFDGSCIGEFEVLKDKLISSPVLSIYDPSRIAELHCDASSHGHSAVLLQRQEDGKLHPIAYYYKKR